MRVDEQCKLLCRIESLSSGQAKAFRTKIEDDYRVNMCVRLVLGPDWSFVTAVFSIPALRPSPKCFCPNLCCAGS